MVVFSVCALDGDKRPTISHNPEAQKATPFVCETRGGLLSAPLGLLMQAAQVNLLPKNNEIILKISKTIKTDKKG